MSRCCLRFAPLWLLIATLMTSAVEAQEFGANYLPRALCVTDPYGVSFHNWYGSPVAFNSYFSTPSNGAYSSGYNGATTGYYMGGVPAVASATTSEWIVQRTSVFPIGAYYPGALYPPLYPQSYPLPAPPPPSIWAPRLGQKPAQQNARSTARREPHPHRAISPTISRKPDVVIQQVSGHLPASDLSQPDSSPPEEGASSDIATGDRMLREGNYSEAYLCYLAAQRDVGDHSEVYFRQAFALVAMRRYTHAVAKLKKGLQLAPEAIQQAASFDEVLKIDADDNAVSSDRRDMKTEWLAQVRRWVKADARDLDRTLLMGFLLHCDRDPQAAEFLNAATKQAKRNGTPSR